MSYDVLFIQQGVRVLPKLCQKESRRWFFLEQNLMIFPSFSTHKHLTTSWHSCWKAFDKYFWDFLPFPLALDELVLESLLHIFHMLHLKSGLSSPAGTSHINPMMLPFPGWMGWKTHGSSELVTGATSGAESPELVHSRSVTAVPRCVGPPAWLLSVPVQRCACTPNPGRPPPAPGNLALHLPHSGHMCLGIPWGCVGTQLSEGGNLPLASELPERESAGTETPRRNSTARRRKARKAFC